ncbi:MAG: DNA polymerase III subunit alpha [Parcubacteria group bacterium]|nr:DNA polymerase III subunit alpha [Parcubacteria group bacterium]
MAGKFTHLHVHSHYSLLDGLPKIDELLDYTKKLGMDSIALTDHGVLYGAVEFYKKAKKAGIKPIIGCEVYVALESRHERRPNIDDKRYHLILLAKNEQGYKNLVKIVSKSHLEGFYYKPRVDEELLKQYAGDIVALSACVQGKVPRLIISNKIQQAKEEALKYQEIFGKGNFFLEIQEHENVEGQAIANKVMIDFSKELDIPLVATNDIHYLSPDDTEAQDVLMLINTGTNVDKQGRLTMKNDDFSMRTKEQMEKFCNDLGVPEAITNTQIIADMCNFEFTLGETKLPHFTTPQNQTPDEYLKELCYQGLEKKAEEYVNNKDEAIKRLEYELSVIKETGFASYFLIVADFVNWAKENRIIVGPGRGSAGGSLVSFLLNVIEVEPLKYGLLFERFLNPSRISMPDIDLDFADKRRDEVIEYISEKYGKDKVAQVITFGTMAARAVIRDVGRAMQIDYSYCDKVAKMVPPGHTLDDCIEKVIEFRQLYQTDTQAKQLIDLAKKLEGCARHASTHACGLVISKEPLDELVPVQYSTKSDKKSIITQYEMYSIDDLGLLKMDLLGLKNLTIIENTLKRIYTVQNKSIDLLNIPLNDEKTFELLRKAQTTSVFQLESEGMKRYLKELKPTVFEDIAIMISLYRPGPIELIPEYIARKHGRKIVEYIHPNLKEVLEPTHGLPIFQEQIMKIAQVLAGFSLSEADVLRKAIGKKIKALLMEQKEKFIEGCVKNNVSKDIAEKVFQWIEPHASYSFNKCLSADTEIYSPTGNIRTIEELYKESKLKKRYKNTGKGVLSLDDNLKIKPRATSEIIKNGVKPIYEITVASGKKIKATKEHRFLTAGKWKKLEDLNTEDRIATARCWPTNKMGRIDWPKHKLALLGHVLSEGNTCHPSSFYLFTSSEEELKEYIETLEKFQNTKATVNKKENTYSVYAGRINIKEKSEAAEWIMNELNIRYKKATIKTIPIPAFRLCNKQLAFLLAKMWNGDGCIDVKNKLMYYATSSEKLANQVQSLLLRFGILAKLYKKKFKYRGGIKIGWTVSFSRYDNILKFVENIGPHLIGKRKSDLKKMFSSHRILNLDYSNQLFARGTSDTIPADFIREKIRSECLEANIPFKTVARWSNVAERLFWADKRKVGYQRETVKKIAESLGSSVLNNWADSDIHWDRIKSIKYAGKEQTYDLTVEKNHNFVANGFIVHNSHAIAYAMIAYNTAYLKAHFSVEFMAAVLTSERNDVERISFLIDECKEMQIEVLAPDINESFHNFSVVPKENKVRFGLLAIKNVGENIVTEIIRERKENGAYKSFSDFTARIATKDFNKKSLESLIKSGVFDKFEERNKLLENMEDILSFNREIRKSAQSNQSSLFDSIASTPPSLQLASAPPIDMKEKLDWEKELLGLYISAHPLDAIKNILKEKALPLRDLRENIPYNRIRVGGIISSIKRIVTKKGQPMIFMKLEDLTDKVEVVVFPSILEANPEIFQENKIVFVGGKVDQRDNEPKIICNTIEEILEIQEV